MSVARLFLRGLAPACKLMCSLYGCSARYTVSQVIDANVGGLRSLKSARARWFARARSLVDLRLDLLSAYSKSYRFIIAFSLLSFLQSSFRQIAEPAAEGDADTIPG